jgi:hypothetical protein
MTDAPTPGQVAYEAYQAAYDCCIWTLPWAQLQPHFRHVWDAAAQAVLAHALAARVWARQAPSSRWQVVPPPQEDTP